MTRIHPLHQLHQPLPVQTVKKPAKQQGPSFKDVFDQAQTLKVSKHAKQRLEQRNISIDDQKWKAISDKMIEAKEKGVTDSLVITENAALVVSTKNHTVVTAMAKDEAASKIFTNINGTILMND
ncbi:flagellar protein [Halobacillus fulvus]|nr:flagellar protein [Halobacillus fulvus]